jgi:hypothetical protein
VAPDSLETGVIRKRYLPIEESKQLPSADMVQLMFVIIRVITERTVVVLETYRSFRVDMFHSAGLLYRLIRVSALSAVVSTLSAET